MRPTLFLLLLFLFLPGCMTFVSQLAEPDVYGGVRLSLEEQARNISAGKYHWLALLILDLPVSLAADTAFLPLTAAARISRSWKPEIPDDEEHVLAVRSRWTHGPFQHLYFDFKNGDGQWRRLEVGRGRSTRTRDGKTTIIRRTNVRIRKADAPGRGATLCVLTGDEAREAIEALLGQVPDYTEGDDGDEDATNGYRIWPGPNSNTFVDTLARRTPHLSFEPSHLAVGKDFARWVDVGRTTTKTGVQLESPLLGVQLGLKEGVELHLLQLTFGVSLYPPAVKVPFQSRLGFSQGGTEPATLSARRRRSRPRPRSSSLAASDKPEGDYGK